MFSGMHDRNNRFCNWDDPEIFKGVITAQWPWEILTLAGMVKQFQPHVLVEIGSQNGGTLRYWLENAPADAIVVAIDPDANLDWLKDDPRLVIFPTRSDDPETIEAVKALGPIDFLFLDGDHHYTGVKWDFENYGPLVRSNGGMIALHDICTLFRDDCQVARLWQEIRAAGYATRELQAIHPTPWGGIGIVFTEAE